MPAIAYPSPSYPRRPYPRRRRHPRLVPDLPELVTWGDGEADALAMAADAIEVIVAVVLQEGRAVPAPATRSG